MRIPRPVAITLTGVFLTLPRPAVGQDALTTCSLAEPVWATEVVEVSQGRAWDTGRRGDGPCEFVLAAWTRSAWASSFASSRPDGLAAPAVGFTSTVSGGVQLRRGPFEVRLMPEVSWHMNSDVEIPSSPFQDQRRFGYQWGEIDLPFRFGADPFVLMGPGRSGVRVHASTVSIGIDAEPVRWGPSRRYPLLLSGQQAALPRVGIRTERPVHLGRLGTIDFNLFYARLASSDWFAAASEAAPRIMSGLTVAWSPRVLPGLTVGASSLHHQYAGDFGLGSAFDWIQTPAQDSASNSSGNGIGNVWLHWGNAEIGVQVWAEWAKDDYNRNVTHLLLEPEKGTGRTLGLSQRVDAGSGQIIVHFESTTTRNSRPHTTDDDGVRGIMYFHPLVREGHTHRGQLLGSIVGPGGDGQFLAVHYRGETWTSVQLERMRFNTDTYTERLGEPLGDDGYDVEVIGRMLHQREFGSIRARGEIELGTRHNRLFLQETDPGWEGNVRLGLMFMWSR